MALTRTEINDAITRAHQHLEKTDASGSVLNSLAISQRVLLSNDIRVKDYDELAFIVADELFPLDEHKAENVKKSLKEFWGA